MTNNKIREAAKGKGVYLWEIARSLNISEPTMTRWMREDLEPEKESKIMFAIDQIAREKAEADY